jgi:predicted permease
MAPGLRLPRLGEIAVDFRALAALSIAAVVIACGAGLVPLFLTGHFAPTAALRTGHETASRPAIRLRSLLIVGETSFVFLLLAAAVLLATSLRAVLAQPLGFEAHDVVTMRVAVPESRYTTRDDTVSFYSEVLDTLRAHPAVRSAGVVSVLPLAGNTGSTLTIEGRDETPLALRPTIGWHWASPGYFAAMGIPIIRGRDFRSDDVGRSPHVTVINAAMARLHFAGEDPIGKRVYFGGFGPGGPPEWHEVIGIVGDVRHRQLDAEPDARAYDLFGQHWGRTISLAVRTSDSPLQVAGLVRSVLAERDPRLAVFSIRTTADLVTNAVATRKVLLWVVGTLATVGLIVSLIGLYGTIAYMVAQRTRELGVRLALGATSRQIWGMVMRRGLQLVAAGIVIGVAAAFVFGRAIEAQLFGVPAANVPALAGAAGGLILAAAAACTAPALRATRVNPVDSLRAE